MSQHLIVQDASLIPLVSPWEITIPFPFTNNFKGFYIQKITMCFLSITDLQKFLKIVAENKTTDVDRC